MVLLCGFYLVCAVFRTEYAGKERFTLKYASTDDASDVISSLLMEARVYRDRRTHAHYKT